MADGTSKPISQIRVGDKIANALPGVIPGTSNQEHTVTAIHITHTDRAYTDVTIETHGRQASITSTNHHLYWDATTHAWTTADHLNIGDQLQAANGRMVPVVEIRSYAAAVVTYNLTVDGVHTFYVEAAQTPVLVHNSGLCDIPWSSGQVSAAARAIEGGATSIEVSSRADAEELFLRMFQGQGYRNATGFDGVGTKQYFGSKMGTYHWDDQLGPDGRVLGHGAGNADGDLPHLQIHTLDDSPWGGAIIRIFWGG
jgi:hypothetical protein